MLPSSLLVARKHRDTIRPVYADFTAANQALAKQLIQAYHDHVTKRKRAVEAVIAALETQGREYRFVRGLAVLLDRRCRPDGPPQPPLPRRSASGHPRHPPRP